MSISTLIKYFIILYKVISTHVVRFDEREKSGGVEPWNLSSQNSQRW